MKQRLLYSLLLLLLLLPFSSTLYAQDLTETFIYDGLSVDYPADWFATEDNESIVVLSIEVDLGEVSDDMPLDLIGVTVASPNQMLSLALDEEQTGDPLVTLNAFLTALDTDAEAELVIVGGYDAARAEVGNTLIPGVESVVYVINVDGTLLLAAIVYGDEYTSEPQIALDILASISLDPTVTIAEATEEAPEPDEPADLDDPDVPLEYGDTVLGEITNRDDDQIWRFSGSEGDVVTITMISQEEDFELDTRLYLYSAEGFDGGDSALTDNDDSPNPDVGTLNSQIEAFELPEDGDYIIVATRFGNGNGIYSLSLEEGVSRAGGQGGDGETANASEAQPIAFGETVEGEINDDTDPQFWQFSGSEGDVVTITMLADDDAFDTRLYLYNAEDTPISINAIADNDDMENSDGFTYNSQIFEFELPTDGDYLIEATRFGGSEGSYTLTLESGDTQASDGGRGELSPVGSGGGDSDGELRQWASDADGSTQYGDDAWSFMQATGEPNVDVCADDIRAWASESPTGEDYLELTYDEAVIPTEINIYQSFTPGSIIRVEVANSDTGEVFEIENSADPGDSPCPGVLTVTIEGAESPVDTVIIYLDQSIGGSWNEIDAVELVGSEE